METPEQGERQHSWYAVTDGSWQWDTGEAPPFITHTDSPRAAVEEAIKDWFEKGQDFDSAELKVARLETCAFTFVEVDENRKWRLERWWDYPSSDASAGLVTVPVEDLARLADAAGKWGKHLRAELHRDAADNIAQSCDTADAILRAAQGEPTA